MQSHFTGVCMRTLLALLGLVVLHALFAVALYAQPPSRNLREVPRDTVVTPLTRHLRLDDITLAWGRDANRRRVMCATSAGGVVTCHRPGLVHRRAAVTELVVGVVLMGTGPGVVIVGAVRSLGCLFEGACEDDDGWQGITFAGSSMIAGGLALFVTGSVHVAKRRRGVRWLREHHASLAPTANLTGASRDVGASLSLTF